MNSITLDIPARELCALLSTPPHQLNALQNAVRKMMESLYSPEQLNSIKLNACLEDKLDQKPHKVKVIKI